MDLLQEVGRAGGSGFGGGPGAFAMDMTYDNFLKNAGELLDLDWRKYRRRSARRHVEERLRELGLSDYGEYLKRLRADSEEARKLPDLMRVTVSRFFREKACWRELAEIALPELLHSKEEGEPLRAWCVGCCSGEEPYSLAMLFLSAFGTPVDAGNRKIDILATDIDEKVLARAHESCYEKGSLREVPPEVLARFFYQSGRLQCVDEGARNLVRFERHNFMEDSAPVGMDLVLCRYLAFTYYRGERRFQAAQRLWKAIRPGGVLMIGRKDDLGPREEELFEPWAETGVMFRRKKTRP